MNRRAAGVVVTLVFVSFIITMTGFRVGDRPLIQTAKPANLRQALQQFQNKDIIYNELGHIGSGSAVLLEVGEDYLKLELKGNLKGVVYIPLSNIQSVLQLKDEDVQLYFR